MLCVHDVKKFFFLIYPVQFFAVGKVVYVIAAWAIVLEDA